MTGVKKKYLLILNLFSVYVSYLHAQETYRAGVYAYKVVQPTETIKNVSRNDALENMMKNIEIYSSVASDARDQVSTIQLFFLFFFIFKAEIDNYIIYIYNTLSLNYKIKFVG